MTVLKLKNSTSTTPPSSLEVGELALCTLAGSEKLYTKNSNNSIINLLDKSNLSTYTYVDSTFLKKSGGTMTGNLTVSSIINTGLYKGGVLDTQAASNAVMIPFVFNDIAHLDKRGGSIETNYGPIPTTLVDGSANYITYTPSALTENVPSGLTITFNLHKLFTYISKVGVSFMTSSNACKYIKIEAYDDILSDWVVIGETSDNIENVYQVSTSMSSRSKLRFTFNDYNSITTNGFRIAGIWLYNYQSKGMKEICVGRDGGEMYGSLYPYATDSNLNLGTSSKKWNNVYANNFNGALVGNASTATKLVTTRTIWGQNFDGSGNVNGDITTSGNLLFTQTNNICWNNGTYQQRIFITDDTTSGTNVFSFQQSTNSGTNWTDLMRIKDDGTIIGNEFSGSLSGNASTATQLQNTRTIWGQNFDGSGNVSGAMTGVSTISASGTITAPTFSGALSGNASTATKLATTRTIWGQNFDGSGNVSGAMTGVSTISASGTITAPTFSGALSGNASTATKLATARTIWGQNFDGSGNVSGALTGVSTISASGSVTVSSIQTLDNDSPSLILRGGSSNPALYVQKSSTGATQIASFRYGSATAGGGTEVMKVDNTGVSVTGKLTSTGTIRSNNVEFLRSEIGDYGVIHKNDGNNYYILFTDYDNNTGNYNSLRPFYINLENGNVTLGEGMTTTTGTFTNTLNVYGATTFGSNVTAGGNITAQGELTAYVASDRNLKENIKPIDNALDVINKLDVVSYNWNDKAKKLNENKTDQKDFGLIAQDVEGIIPEIVHNIHDDKYKAIDYIKLIPFLIKSVQELNEKVEKQQEIIKQLQNN